MATGKDFDGEPDFCNDCGAILPLPDQTNEIICKVCNWKGDVSAYDGVEIYSEYVFNSIADKKSKRIVPQQDVPQGPTVDRKCSKCGHEGMTYATLQLRSADEGQTVFYTCPQCSFKEIENS